ncbi:Lrp/AsnC ligand binding domain-containing protein [Bradyrhizobium sp. Leo170]|uniref:Lrp/AsnC ligand binding domain-containing protein n=1 Tax=Bradyrhizobium sp. Leo170 TaxID=1571199 RepID=UPI00102EA844|nr:Lrp/AsnC ligand binding domain-containing protein [Bradyrhizobium sp. Leo170]TAI67405.1 hypothetical protein CWO89_03090 [Bradyrhizobium sp. Leo170]
MNSLRSTSDSDYLLRVMVSDIEDLEDLIVNKISRIPGVSSIRSNLALKRISHKTVLPIDTSRPVTIKACNSTSKYMERPAKPRYDSAAQARGDSAMGGEAFRTLSHSVTGL